MRRTLCVIPSWSDVSAEAPDFARRVEQALTRNKHLTMATLRADGSPRISGTELEISDGNLWLGSMRNARKARDLLRDSRMAIHGPTADPPEDPKGWPGEAKVSGRAIEVPHDETAHRFRIDIEEVVFTHPGPGAGAAANRKRPSDSPCLANKDRKSPVVAKHDRARLAALSAPKQIRI